MCVCVCVCRCRDEHNGRAAAEALATQLKQQVGCLLSAACKPLSACLQAARLQQLCSSLHGVCVDNLPVGKHSRWTRSECAHTQGIFPYFSCFHKCQCCSATACAPALRACLCWVRQVTSLEGATQLVGELRSGMGRLEATVAGDAAVISDLRARLAAAEAKLETEMEAKVSVAWEFDWTQAPAEQRDCKQQPVLGGEDMPPTILNVTHSRGCVRWLLACRPSGAACGKQACSGCGLCPVHLWPKQSGLNMMHVPTLTHAQGDLAGRHRSAEMQASNLNERNAKLSTALAESEARARAVGAKLDALEDAHEATKHALQQVSRHD